MPRFNLVAETIDKRPAILWCLEVGEEITLAGLPGYEIQAWQRQQALSQLETLEATWNKVSTGKTLLPTVIASNRHDAILRGLVWLNEATP